MRNLRRLLQSKPWLSSKAQSRRRRGDHSVRLSRILRNETLERRQLLAGDIAFAHNYWAAADVDSNQEITANDALRVINQLSRNQGSFEIIEAGQIDSYADVNADGWVTASDALLVINSLSRGEALDDEAIRLDLNARDIDDNALTTNDLRSIEVEVGQPFFLEVSYVQGGSPFDQRGAFQIITDVLFEQEGSPFADAVTPVLTETQRVIFENNLRQSTSGSMTFSLEGASGSVEVSLGEFLGSSELGAGAIEDALIALGGYEEGTFRVARVRDEFGTFPGQPSDPDSATAPGNLVYEIRYTDLQFSGDDLPDLQVVADLNNGVRSTSESSPPVNPDGSLNYAAAGNNIDSRSRTFPDDDDDFGNEVYNQFKFGSFDPAFGFDEIGAIGPLNQNGIPGVVGVGPGNFVQPFDTFSIPLIVNRPVTNMSVRLALADNNERVLLYGEDDPVESDEILLDARSQFALTAIGDSENTPPVAVDDTATTPEETPIDIDVLANDSDDDEDPLTVALGSVAPTRGTVSVNQDGTILYTPNEGELGTDTFTYVANDGQADSGEATVTVTITEVNDPPVLDGEVAATFSEDDPAGTVDLLDLASDPDNDPLSVVDLTLDSGDAAGISIDLANNRLEIDPNAYNSLAEGENEVVVYSYGITDGQGNTVSQTATITVTGVNDAPVANPDESDADGMNPLLIDVLANDSDPDGDGLTLALGADPQNGSVRIVDGQIEYTAGQNADFVDTFTYTISDGIADPVEATVTVNVSEENLAPTVGDPIVANFTEDTGEQTIDLLDGAEDPNEGDTLNVDDLQVSPESPLGVSVSDGIVTVDTDVYQFLAEGQVAGPITFTYRVSDGVLSVEQTATLTITGVNDAPVAADDEASTVGMTPVLIDVLANDGDPDGDTLTVAVATDPQFGTAVVEGNQIRYTANENVARTDTFTYTISDGIADPVEATVTVNVLEENLPPTVGDPIVANFTEDTGEQTLELLNGAEDPNGDSLNVVDLQISPGSPLGVSVIGGTVTVDTDVYQFLAEGEVTDPITFTYGVTDGEFTVAQTATLTITGVNDAPVAADDEANTIGTAPVLIDVLANDDDPDGDDLTVAVQTGPQFGTAVVVGNQIQYTADDNVARTDTFTYAISDGIADPVEATVTVNVFEENLPPTVGDPIEANFTEDTGEQTLSLLGGAEDPNGDSLDVVDLQISPDSPAGVTVENGTVTLDTSAYQSLAEGEVSGPITFSYGVSDGEFTVTQTATLTITGVNDAPVAADVDTSTLKNGSVAIDVLAEATDPDLIDVLSVVEATDGSNGDVTVNADGSLTYTPAIDFTGVDSFTYTITDGIATSQATVTVTVNDFAPSMVAGTIFFDHLENIREVLNGAEPIRDGVKDDDESGLGGSPVLLVSGADENVSGEEIRRVVYTGVHGDYEFDNVVPGTYQVIFEIPETIKFHQNGDGSSEPGVMEIFIGPQGGEDFSDKNFTLINTIGSATGNTDILTQPNPGPNPDGNEDRKIGLVRLSESGEQEYFRAFRGFESFVFAELTLNDSRDTALLSVIDDDGTLLTARISDDRFVVNEDGTTVQFYGTGDDFNFTPADSSSHSDEFSNYRNAIDKVLGSYGLDD